MMKNGNAPGSARRSTRLITFATLLLLSYTVVGFLVVPLLIRKVGCGLAERRLNGTVAMERASFNPYTFRVTVDGLEITEPDGARVAAVDHFDGNLQLFSSIFRPGWRFVADLDGAAAPQGRAFDLALKVHRDISERWSVGVGYRTLEGGADNDTVYTFAWIHQALVSLSYRF